MVEEASTKKMAEVVRMPAEGFWIGSLTRRVVRRLTLCQ